MVFKSERQRRAFFAQKRGGFQAQEQKFTVFSYRDGKRLGTFSNINEVFNKFPSERKAFQRVIDFRRKTGIKVNTIEEIKKKKERQRSKRWN